jgi:sugar phosphate isomerase/epimerase
MSRAGVIWLAGGPAGRARAAGLATALEPGFKALFLGPAGEPAPDLLLDPANDLSLALDACPLELRPAAALCLEPDAPPAGLAGLPCPTLAWGAPAEGCDQVAPADPVAAAQALRRAAAAGRAWPWLAQVQVNLPLRFLLGRYRPLAEELAVNPEVGIDALALDQLGPAELDQAAGLLAGRRVSVHLPFLDLSPGSPDPAIARTSLERLAKAADWAIKLGASRAVGHLGYLADTHRDLEAFSERLAKGLAPIATRLAEGGCPLTLENTFEPAPDVLLAAREAIIAAKGPAVDFCLDLGHAYCFSVTPLEAWWEALAPHIGELHLHDNDGGLDSHQPPGRGVVDWAYVKRQASSLPAPPLLTLEPHAEPDLWASLRALERVWGKPFLPQTG